MTFKDPRHTIINKAGYTKFIPQIADNVSPYAAMYLAELLNSDSYWMKNFKKKTGRKYTGTFYHNRHEIKKRTGLSFTYQRNAQKELENLNIISVEKKGLPRRNYFTINYEELDAFLLQHMNSMTNEEDDESLEIDENNDQPLVASTTSRQPELPLATVQNHDILNKNKEIRLNNKNKVSKDTYVPDGTESIDSASDQDLDCVEHTKISCIKKKEAQSPSRKQVLTAKDEALEIIEEYNHAMDIHIKPGKKEISTVLENIEQMNEIRKYFTPEILNKVWNELGDDYTNSLEHRRLSAFIKCGLMTKLQTHQGMLVKAQDEEIDQLLDRVFKQYGNQISPIIEDLGFHNSYGSLEPIDASIHFPPKAHRELRLNIYNQHIQKLLSRDEKLDMIKLEVK